MEFYEVASIRNAIKEVRNPGPVPPLPYSLILAPDDGRDKIANTVVEIDGPVYPEVATVDPRLLWLPPGRLGLDLRDRETLYQVACNAFAAAGRVSSPFLAGIPIGSRFFQVPRVKNKGKVKNKGHVSLIIRQFPGLQYLHLACVIFFNSTVFSFEMTEFWSINIPGDSAKSLNELLPCWDEVFVIHAALTHTLSCNGYTRTTISVVSDGPVSATASPVALCTLVPIMEEHTRVAFTISSNGKDKYIRVQGPNTVNLSGSWKPKKSIANDSSKESQVAVMAGTKLKGPPSNIASKDPRIKTTSDLNANGSAFVANPTPNSSIVVSDVTIETTIQGRSLNSDDDDVDGTPSFFSAGRGEVQIYARNSSGQLQSRTASIKGVPTRFVEDFTHSFRNNINALQTDLLMEGLIEVVLSFLTSALTPNTIVECTVMEVEREKGDEANWTSNTAVIRPSRGPIGK
ncbi:hypothetical protein F5050DRAFT_1872801 [Lentinula boryana]|uniref:Nucleoplasmin-like domain-containing protein n=1 Tax=Lentinula boryana TaxID=40481 RepID=A0ABQ8PXZ6_9AGAR|nr:hypothetical protein F5050DRAFT_1872801 [Lentinula boryana]